MPFLATDFAIFKRLTGAPLDSQGRPLRDPIGIPANQERVMPPDQGGGFGPSYGVRIPLLKHPYDTAHGLSSKDPDAYRMFAKGFDKDSFRQIPVFTL